MHDSFHRLIAFTTFHWPLLTLLLAEPSLKSVSRVALSTSLASDF